MHKLLTWLLLLFAGSAQATPIGIIQFGGPSSPTFSVACGSYSSTQSVTLSAGGTSIYYTTDGTTPTTASTLYSSAISVSASETLNAISATPLLGRSAIATCAYAINSVRAPTGHWILSKSYADVAGSYGLAQIEPEIDAAFAGGSVIAGYQLYVYWAQMQTGAGVYNFTLIDAVRNYIAQNYPTKGFSLVLYQNDFFNSNPTGVVPPNILSSSVYGPGYDSDEYGYGYWQSEFGAPASLAAFWRSNAIQGMPVEDQLVTFASALGSHVWTGAGNTGGWTYNTDPNFMSFTPIEENGVGIPASGAGSDSTLTESAFNTNWISLQQQVAAALPSVTILNADNFGAGAAGTQSDTNSRINSAAALNVTSGNKQITVSGPDLFILQSEYTYGQLAYLGLGSGSTNQTANMPWAPRVETGSQLMGEDPGVDPTVTLAKLFAVANGNGATAIFWQPGYVTGGTQYGFTVSQILAFAAANPF